MQTAWLCMEMHQPTWSALLFPSHPMDIAFSDLVQTTDPEDVFYIFWARDEN
jgi:hypothetical protein